MQRKLSDFAKNYILEWLIEYLPFEAYSYSMKKRYLAITLFLFAESTFACECHGTSGFGFGSFIEARLPTQECIAEHVTLANGMVSYAAQTPNPEANSNTPSETPEEEISETVTSSD